MNARSTKFAKLRIKSEKADALAIERDRSRWLRRQLFRTLSSALRNGRICAQLRVQICGEPRSFLPSYILGSWSDRGIILLFSSPHIRGPLPSIADGHQPPGHHDPTPPYGPRHPLVHCLLVSCICALLAICTDPPAYEQPTRQHGLSAHRHEYLVNLLAHGSLPARVLYVRSSSHLH